MAAWIDKLKAAEKTGIVQNNRHKIHYTFSDETQLVEEYDLSTRGLMVRKWKKPGKLGGISDWQLEVGEEGSGLGLGESGLMESNTNPKFVRRDAKDCFCWRIRNLPYPLEVYSVTIEDRRLVLRTSNKKYFKKFSIPDLDRMELSYHQGAIKLAHASNTLVISYKKPQEILKFEKALQQEISKLDLSKDEGIHDCKTQ